MKIALTDTGIAVRRLLSAQFHPWSDVRRISAVQADQITYSENFLIFELVNGKSISVGELDATVTKLREILWKFGVDRDWYGELEAVIPGTTLLLYEVQ